MKTGTTAQLKEADRVTLEKQNISELALMERAAKKAAEEIYAILKNNPPLIHIFCGKGNNGGDGLVIARYLHQNGFKIKTYIVNYTEKASSCFIENYAHLAQLTNQALFSLNAESNWPKIAANDCVVDAIFGLGLNRALPAWVAQLIKHINISEAQILAIDLPSGLFADRAMKLSETAIRASQTYTFQLPKLVFFLPETAAYVGQFRVLAIGLDASFLKKMTVNYELVEESWLNSNYKKRKKFTHKGTYGHVLLIGGSYGMMGSMVLAATATLRAGAGKLTVLIPKCGYDIMQSIVPEAMVLTSDTTNHISNKKIDFTPNAICFGMGAGKHPETRLALQQLLAENNRPMVVDADGLNLLAENKNLLKLLPKDSILTPHPKELERLLGKWEDDFEKLQMAQDFTNKYKLILVIKGAHSFIITPSKTYINTTGNPGMATAGSGDVLSGVITGLLAQGYLPLHAAVMGVYLHGKAGDIAAQKGSEEGLIAGDINWYLRKAFQHIFHCPL